MEQPMHFCISFLRQIRKILYFLHLGESQRNESLCMFTKWTYNFKVSGGCSSSFIRKFGIYKKVQVDSFLLIRNGNKKMNTSRTKLLVKKF